MDNRPLRPAYWEPDQKWLTVNKENIRAIKAVWDGKANDAQQVMAISFILDGLCNRAGNQFYADERETTFALGKKFIGDQIVGAINAKLGKIEEAKK